MAFFSVLDRICSFSTYWDSVKSKRMQTLSGKLILDQKLCSTREIGWPNLVSILNCWESTHWGKTRFYSKSNWHYEGFSTSDEGTIRHYQRRRKDISMYVSRTPRTKQVRVIATKNGNLQLLWQYLLSQMPSLSCSDSS